LFTSTQTPLTMRTLIATLLTYANADETSLMQDRVKHMASTQLSTYGDVSSTESRHDSTSRLLETAEKMIKNGVTPDVIIFVDAIVAEINDVVLPAILEEHQEDQNYIDELCARFTAAVDRLRADTEDMMVFSEAQSVASLEHHTCRSQEAYVCARSRSQISLRI